MPIDIHEAGHAVATCALRPGSLGVVSLQASAGVGGTTVSQRPGSGFVPARRPAPRPADGVAGRAAEAAVFGVASSGAGGREHSDLAQVTCLAVNAMTAWGLDDAGGLVWRGQPEIQAIPDLLAAHPALAERVRVVLDEAYAEACGLIHPRITAVEALARTLLMRGVLDGPDAEAILHQHLGQAKQQP